MELRETLVRCNWDAEEGKNTAPCEVRVELFSDLTAAAWEPHLSLFFVSSKKYREMLWRLMRFYKP